MNVHSYNIIEINTIVVPSMTRMQLGEVRYGSMHVHKWDEIRNKRRNNFSAIKPNKKGHGGGHRFSRVTFVRSNRTRNLFFEKKKNWIR